MFAVTHICNRNIFHHFLAAEQKCTLCVFSSDADLDQQLTGSELLLSALLQNTVQGLGGPDGLTVTSEGPYDFYQQPNMSEARLCLPVLEQLSVAARQRLEEWPEHPALVQVSYMFISRSTSS